MRVWVLLGLLVTSAVRAELVAQVCAEQGIPDGAIAAAREANDGAVPGQALLEVFRCQLPADSSTAIERVRQLLDADAPLDYTDDSGRTALHAALEGIHPPTEGPVHFYRDAARLLLARGADPVARDQQGTQPLHLAAREARGQVSQLLLDLGADPLATDDSGRNALQHAATGTDNLDTFALLLGVAQGDAPLPEQTLQRLAGLAAARHDHGKLNLLLQLDPQLLIEGADATASLARALWQGAPLEVIRRLAGAGADPTALPTTGGGDLAWRLATLGREAELDWLLAQGFPLNALPESGIPPLFYADISATRLLLARDADPALSSATLGPTAAALTPPPAPFDDGGSVIHPEKLALLLKAGYPPDLTDPQGRTALEHAVRSNTHWLSRALLEAGASPLPNSDGHDSLLPLAVTRTRVTTLQVLLRAVPDATERHPGLLLTALDSDEPQPLTLEALLVAGFDTAARNARGETPLLVAARRQLWPLVTLLLRYGADPDAVNHSGCTLQCYAWSMPEQVHDELAPYLGHADTGWQAPTINERPLGFFTLSLAPVLGLWLLLCGYQLLGHRSLLPATVWLFTSGISAVVAGAVLFYQCQPCVLTDPRPQMGLTAALAAALFLLLWWRFHPGNATQQPDAGDSAGPAQRPASSATAAREGDLEPQQHEHKTEMEPDDWIAPPSQDGSTSRETPERNPDGSPRGFW